MTNHGPIPDSDPPDKRLQFCSHAGLLYAMREGPADRSLWYLRTMDTHKIIAEAGNLYDLLEPGNEYVEAHSA